VEQRADKAKDGRSNRPGDTSPCSSVEKSAALRAPAGVHYVSVRADARDSSGNSVSQTVIRAFGVR
jgi:hypothetical protein